MLPAGDPGRVAVDDALPDRLLRDTHQNRQAVSKIGEDSEPDLDPVCVGLHGQALEDLQGLIQERDTGLGLSVAQMAFAAAFQRVGFVVSLRRFPSQGQSFQVKMLSMPEVTGLTDNGRVAIQSPGLVAPAANAAERVNRGLQ